MTEAGNTSVLRTGRFYFTTKNQTVKMPTLYTLGAYEVQVCIDENFTEF
jgi:hypothetical protein